MAAKRDRFAKEFLIDRNATKAALRCGFSKKSAHVTGCRLLKQAKIATEIAKGEAAQTARAEVSADRILAEADRLSTADLSLLVDFSGPEPRLKDAKDIPPEAWALVQSFKVKRVYERDGDERIPVDYIEVKLWDKVGALRLSMQHRGMLVERHAGPNGEPLQFTVKIVKPRK